MQRIFERALFKEHVDHQMLKDQLHYFTQRKDVNFRRQVGIIQSELFNEALNQKLVVGLSPLKLRNDSVEDTLNVLLHILVLLRSFFLNSRDPIVYFLVKLHFLPLFRFYKCHI